MANVIVPENPQVREWILWKHDQSAWYARAGYSVEPNEYRVPPERRAVEHRGVAGARSEPVLSLDPFDIPTLPAVSLYPPGTSESEDEDRLVSDVAEISGLQPREVDATAWVVAGNPMTGPWAARMGESLGIGRDAARKAWSRAKRKLRGEWTREPVQAVREPIRGQREGAGVYPWEAYAVWWDYHRPRFDTTPSWV